MERRDELFKIAEEAIPQINENTLIRLRQDFEREEEALTAALASKLQELVLLTLRHQKEQNKNSIKYLTIFNLMSSVLTGSYEVQLSFYDETLYLDPINSSVYWNVGFLYQYLEEDTAKIQKIISKRIIRVKKHEIKELKQVMADGYHILEGMFFFGTLYHALRHVDFGTLEIEENVTVLYGGLMDKVILFPQLVWNPQTEKYII